MKKGIIQDKKTGKWEISTSFYINGKKSNCHIRGYETKRQAEQDYDRATSDWKARRGLYDERVVLFSDLREEYDRRRAIKMKRGTLLKDKGLFNKHLMPRFGNTPVFLVFNKNTITYFYNSLDVSNNVKYRLILLMRDLCLLAYNSHFITETDYQDCMLVMIVPNFEKNNGDNKRYATKDEKEAFLATLKDSPTSYAMFSIFFFLGCRISELLGICKDSVDLKNKTITIKRQLMTNAKLTNILKTNSSYRVIPLNDECCNLITPLMDNKYTRLFPISHTQFKRLLHRHEQLADIPNYSSHEIGRHTRCFELAKKCVNMGDVNYCAKIMGHSSTVFLDVYCNHFDMSLKDKFLD